MKIYYAISKQRIYFPQNKIENNENTKLQFKQSGRDKAKRKVSVSMKQKDEHTIDRNHQNPINNTNNMDQMQQYHRDNTDREIKKNEMPVFRQQ